MPARVIAHNSDEYRRAVQLRREVLRWPLGMDYTEEQLAGENDSAHFLLDLDGKAVATAMATPYQEGILKVRQVAVDPSVQGKGHGSNIMFCAEDW